MEKEQKELIKKCTELLLDQKYEEIIEFLNDTVLDDYNISELYSLRSLAHANLKQIKQCLKYAQKAVDLENSSWSAYNSRARGRYENKEYLATIEDTTTAISLNPQSHVSFNLRGNSYKNIGELDKAIQDYNKAIEINPKFYQAYNNRGLVYNIQNKDEEAINDFNKSIALNPKNWTGYYNRMLIYLKLNEFKKAINDSIKVSNLNSNVTYNYFVRGESWHALGKIDKAIDEFNNYVRLNEGKDSYYIEKAKSKINELTILVGSNKLNKISETVNEIKKIMLFENGEIIHYTGLSTAKLLLTNDAVFRISEGSFLNDTSEGTELINFLEISPEKMTSRNFYPERFVPKPFIGSFVEQSMHDNLNLWRMYGKDLFQEAKGCSITIQAESFINLIISKLDLSEEFLIQNNEDINFYYVAYRESSEPDYFALPSINLEKQIELNEKMNILKQLVKEYMNSTNYNYSDLERFINELAYLFKSDVYKSENELRLVVNGVGFEKMINGDSQPPKVFIELVNLKPITTRITLGPKVDRKEEWAAAFYYMYDEATAVPEIIMSNLPFK
jgi:tetratricopeptide (TPR) repeat protein